MKESVSNGVKCMRNMREALMCIGYNSPESMIEKAQKASTVKQAFKEAKIRKISKRFFL